MYPHDAHLRRYLRGSYPGVRDVDDVVQESYLRVWRARTREPIRCARAFLFRVARNIALNLVARDGVAPFEPSVDSTTVSVPDAGSTPAERASTQDELRLLARAIDELPSRCREIVILRRIHNLSQKEIAVMLGITEGTVEVQVVKGVQKCAEFMRRHGARIDHV